MEAEAVRKRVSLHLQVFLNYYSVATLAISVITYKYPNEKIDTWNMMISIFLLGIVIVMTSLDLENKANEFKKSYILLSELEAKTDHLEVEIISNSGKTDFKEVNTRWLQLQEEYVKIMSKTNNHSDFDFLKYMVSNLGSQGKISCFTKMKYYFSVVVYYVIIVLFAILPFYILFKKTGMVF